MCGVATMSPRERRRQKCWQIVRRHYHDRGWIHPSRVYEQLLAEVITPGAAVLDLGCGRTFPLAAHLLKCGGEIHGLDPVAKPEQAVPGVTCRRGTAERIPYPCGTFDVVICRSVLEHLRNPAAAFLELRRILKPGGRAVFMTPSKYDYVSLAARLIPNTLHGRIVRLLEGRDEADTFPTYYRANSRRQIRCLSAKAGLEVASLTCLSDYPSMLLFSPFLCRIAIAYDELVRRFTCLHGLQGSILGVLRATPDMPAPPAPRPAESEHETSGPKRVAMLVTNRGFDDPRVCMEAEALAQQGHALTVIGWDRDIDHDTDRTQNGVRFLGLRLRSTHGRGITQPLFLSGFWWRAWRVLRGLRPAVIHCHDLDTLPLGLAAARSFRSRLVFDAHENFPDMMTGHLLRPAVSALRWLERHLVPRCDAVITVGERLAEHYRKLGGRKVMVVGNWKDPADFQLPADEIRRTREELGLQNGIIAVCFVGNLGRERRLEPLMQAVGQDPRFACVIGGDGPQADGVRRYAAEHRNVFYLGRVPPDRVPLITAACDVVYYGFDETNPNARWSAPNKLYEALAAGKPLLTGNFGEIGATVREQACGLVADLHDAANTAAALGQLAAPGILETCGRNARQAGKTFSRARAATILTEAYKHLA